MLIPSLASAADPASDQKSASMLAVRVGSRLNVTINRPDKRNALSRPVLAALKDIFERHAPDAGIKVVVLTGAGDKSFAACGDLKELASIRSREGAEQMSRETRAALDAIRQFPVPVIAALNGDALGGGAELAAACDLRVAAPHARIGFIQGKLAITTAWGGGIDLGALVGPSRALALLARSDMLAASDAQALGLIDDIAKTDEPLQAAVDRFVAPMLEKPRHVLAAFKALTLAQRRGASRAELATIETALFAEAWVHDDHWAAADGILDRRPR